MRCTGKKRSAGAAAPGYTQREWERLNEQDRQEQRRSFRLILILAVMLLFTGCMMYLVYYAVIRSHDYNLKLVFDKNNIVYGFPEKLDTADTSPSFAKDLCVTDGNVNATQVQVTSLSGGLFDLSQKEVIYANDIFTRRSPASMTKVMTVLTALKYGNPDDIVTVTDTAKEIEFGSSVCDIHTGDKLSLKQLLYGMLIASGNDAAMMVAEHVGGGSVSHFVDLMNQEALSLGATRTHFTNPHGLTDSDHYTCVYDLYLMFREAMKSDMFMDMISRKNYYAEYKNAEDTPVAVTWESTNHYFTGEASQPENIIVYGGKTGTTEDAGACLILLVKDVYGNPYLAVLMHSSDKDVLYEDMNRLLLAIGRHQA